MAVTAIWSVKGSVGKVLRYVANPAKTWNGQYAEAAKYHTVERVLEYDADAMKTEKQFYVTGINCSDSLASAAEQFRATKEIWKKPGGIVCFHGYQSFEAGEVTPDIAHEIGVKLAKQLWGDRFQVVVSTHTNTRKIHKLFYKGLSVYGTKPTIKSRLSRLQEEYSGKRKAERKNLWNDL